MPPRSIQVMFSVVLGRQCCCRTLLAVSPWGDDVWPVEQLAGQRQAACLPTITAMFTSGDKQQFRYSR